MEGAPKEFKQAHRDRVAAAILDFYTCRQRVP